MSLKHSVSTYSTSSSATTSTIQPNDEIIDPSNMRYNDRQNYQIIFSNDSRFFDTSLHLFKSYRNLGYIQIENKRSKKYSSANTLKPEPDSLRRGWRSKPPSFSSNFDIHRSPSRTPNRINFLRNDERSSSRRSDPGLSKPKPLKTNDNSDEPDIIITRL